MRPSRRPSSFRLQRFARGVGVRVFALAMALLLVLANFGAWAAPVAGSASSPTAHAATAGMDHRHCEDAAVKAEKAAAQQASHGKGCPCCVGGACACLYFCMGALATAWPELAPPPSLQSLPPPEASFVEAAGERRLRPPIV